MLKEGSFCVVTNAVPPVTTQHQAQNGADPERLGGRGRGRGGGVGVRANLRIWALGLAENLWCHVRSWPSQEDPSH